jgi:CrcB protein
VHLKLALIAALGGALGSAARYLAGAAALRMMGPGFPWGTLYVNVVGSFAMGAVAGLAIYRSELGPDMRVFLTTGVLGGFTTFSAFSLDAALLAEKSIATAAIYVGASVVVSLLALYAGLAVTR